MMSSNSGSDKNLKQTHGSKNGLSRPPRDISLERSNSYLPSSHRSFESPFKRTVRLSPTFSSEPRHPSQQPQLIRVPSPCLLQNSPPINTSTCDGTLSNNNLESTSPTLSPSNSIVIEKKDVSERPALDSSDELDNLLAILATNIDYKSGGKFKLPITQRLACKEALLKIKDFHKHQNPKSTNQDVKLTSIEHHINVVSEKLDIIKEHVAKSSKDYTYSEMLQKAKPPTPFIIKPNENQTTDGLLEDIQKHVAKPLVKKIYKNKNFIEVKFHSNEHKNCLKEKLLNSGINLSDKQTKLRSLILLNVPIAYSPDEILDFVKTNGDFVNERDRVEVNKTSIPHKRDPLKHHVTFKCSHLLANRLLQLNYIFVGFTRCFIKKRLVLIRCRNCQEPGHHQNNCSVKSSYCENCGEEHPTSDCHSNQIQCVNCLYYNQDHPEANFNTNHKASEALCPTYLLRLKELRFNLPRS